MHVPGASDGNHVDDLNVQFLVEPFTDENRRAGSGEQQNFLELLSRNQELDLRACVRPGQSQGWIGSQEKWGSPVESSDQQFCSIEASTSAFETCLPSLGVKWSAVRIRPARQAELPD